MDFLLTWVVGEEVNYKFLKLSQVRTINLEDDTNYSLTNLRSGRQVEDIGKFLEEVA